MTDIPHIRRSPMEHEHCLPAPAAPQVSVANDPRVRRLVDAAKDRLHSDDCDCGACMPLRAALAALSEPTP